MAYFSFEDQIVPSNWSRLVRRQYAACSAFTVNTSTLSKVRRRAWMSTRGLTVDREPWLDPPLFFNESRAFEVAPGTIGLRTSAPSTATAPRTAPVPRRLGRAPWSRLPNQAVWPPSRLALCTITKTRAAAANPATAIPRWVLAPSTEANTNRPNPGKQASKAVRIRKAIQSARKAHRHTPTTEAATNPGFGTTGATAARKPLWASVRAWPSTLMVNGVGTP